MPALKTPWLLFLLVSLAGLGSAARAVAAPPNVVLIISDDQAWSDFGFMGHPDIRTPHLDRLASQSLLFTRGYVPTSLCRASLMSIITGLYPHQHKVTSNDPPPGTDRQEMLGHVQEHPTLPRLLGERGYRSLQTGKWWEGHYRLGGFTDGITHGDPRRRGRHGDEGLAIGRQGMQPIFDFIDQCGEQPFFIWYAPMMPHSPHAPPERLLAHYKKPGRSDHVSRYYAMCEWFDETCGELLDYLQRKRLSDNTLVVFVTDNGWIQDENSPRYAPKSKRSPYDGGLRTPIMLRWPGKIAPRRDEESLASSVDLAPTILAACGAAPTDAMPGINLLEVQGSQPARAAREAVFGATYTHDAVGIDEPAENLLYRWCIEGDWKLILPHVADKSSDKGRTNAELLDASQKPELYHLETDPWEEQNLADEEPRRVARLKARIDGWWQPTSGR